MMGDNRTNQNNKPSASGNPTIQSNNAYTNSISPNMHSVSSMSFREGNVGGGRFDSVPDLTIAPGWGNLCLMNQPALQGNPETGGNSMAYYMNNPNSFPNNPQITMNSNSANMNLPEAQLLPEWNMRWGPQFINQGHGTVSGGGNENPTMARNIASFNRPQMNSYSPFVPTATEVHNNQSGAHSKFEGSFLSLGIGGTDATTTNRSQVGPREFSDRVKEAATAELKMARARRAMGQSQTLDPGFMGFNQSGRISGSGSVPFHMLQMQQNDLQHDGGSNSDFLSRNIRYGDLDRNRAFGGIGNTNQATHSGGHNGNFAQFVNPQQFDLNGLASDSSRPSWIGSHTSSGQLQNVCSMNSPNAGTQFVANNGMPTQGLVGGNLFPQKRVNTGQTFTDLPFPKRLGVDLNGKDGPQVAEQYLSSRGVNLQTNNTGQVCQFPDKGPTYPQNHLFGRSIDRTGGAPVSYSLNPQLPFSAHGQYQNAFIPLPKDPRGAASSNVSSIDGFSQKSDFQTRAYYKRSTTAPPSSGTHWVQRQKITHPAVHHPVPVPVPFPAKPAAAIPLTSPHIHSSIPVAAAPIQPSIQTSHPRRSRVPVATPPAVSHITWKDPDSTPQMSEHKCFLCKRNLSLTPEGAVYQPVPPPPVAVLPCGHTFHDQCLQNITPQDQSKDPPCIPCAIGDN